MRQLFSFFRRNIVAFIFLLFFMYLITQYSTVFLYHDDYAHASLSYGFSEPDVAGTKFTFGQLVHYVSQYAQMKDPHVFFMFLDALLHRFGLGITRVVAALLVLAFFIFIYKLAKPEKGYSNPGLMAVICLLTFGLCSVSMYRDTFYWFVALFSYIGGFSIFLFALYLRQKWTSLSISKYVALFILFFISSFGQENLFCTVFTYCILSLLWKVLSHKKSLTEDLVCLSGSIIAIILPLLLFSSNRYASLAEEGSLARIGVRYQELFDYLFAADYNLLFFFFMATVALACSYFLYKRGKHIFSIITVAITGFFILFSFITLSGPLDFLSRLDTALGLLIMTLYVILFLVICSMCLWEDKKILSLFWGGVVSFAPCLLAPYIVARMSVFFQFILGIVFLRLISELYREINKYRPKKKLLVFSLTAAFVMITLLNLTMEYHGYAANYPVSSHNDAELKIAHERIAGGEIVDYIVLYKHNLGSIYTGDQSWWDSHRYIETFMKEYYDLPADIEFRYMNGQTSFPPLHSELIKFLFLKPYA